MKEFEKKDLRTGDRVTITTGKEYTVLLNTGSKSKDILISNDGWVDLNGYNSDLTRDVCNRTNFYIIKVERPRLEINYAFRDSYETIYERTEKLPYNAWYRFKDGDSKMMAFYTDETTAFGFNVRGEWADRSERWTPLNCGQLEPVPTEEWQARLIEYAKSIGFVKGAKFKAFNHHLFINGEGKEVQEISNGEDFSFSPCLNDILSIWVNTGEYNSVLFTPSEGWAEIIKTDQVVLVCHTQCVMLDDESETLTVGKEYPVKNENNIDYVIIDDEGHYHHFPKETDDDGDSFKKWFYIKGEKEELHSDLSTKQLIELLKKRTGANHVQISMDKQ